MTRQEIQNAFKRKGEAKNAEARSSGLSSSNRVYKGRGDNMKAKVRSR